MKSLAAFSIFVLTGLVVGQDPKPAPATPPAAQVAPKQDAAALKLLEKFDSLLYIAQQNGLKDVSFDCSLPIGLVLQVKWKSPDKMAADVVVPADAPAEKKKQLELISSTVKGQAQTYARSFVQLIVGESEGKKRAGDDIALSGENQIKITAVSETSKREFKEEVLTFDERGLVKHIKVTSPMGAVSEIDPTYVEKGGKFLYTVVTNQFGDATAKTSTAMKFDYVDVDGITVISKMTTSGTNAGTAMPENVMQFTNHQVNKGIDDAVFGK